MKKEYNKMVAENKDKVDKKLKYKKAYKKPKYKHSMKWAV